jgi:hypothetical protein
MYIADPTNTGDGGARTALLAQHWLWLTCNSVADRILSPCPAPSPRPARPGPPHRRLAAPAAACGHTNRSTTNGLNALLVSRWCRVGITVCVRLRVDLYGSHSSRG